MGSGTVLMTKIMDGVEVTSYEDDPPVLVEGTVDGRVFMLKVWKQTWEFRVADVLVDLRMEIEPIYIERNRLEVGAKTAGLGLLVEKVKEIIKSCIVNYRLLKRGNGHQ